MSKRRRRHLSALAGLLGCFAAAPLAAVCAAAEPAAADRIFVHVSILTGEGLTGTSPRPWEAFQVFESLEREGKLPLRIGEWFTFNDPVGVLTRERARLGFQIGFHAIGDRGVAMALQAFAAAEAAVPPASSAQRRFRIEHDQVIAPADLARQASLRTRVLRTVVSGETVYAAAQRPAGTGR